jgi:hypothetical protein
MTGKGLLWVLAAAMLSEAFIHIANETGWRVLHAIAFVVVWEASRYAERKGWFPTDDK